MSIAIKTESPPLREDASGAIRIGNTRVLLELVIRAFQDGATPEAIVLSYTSLSLSDTYSVIGYYLRHREEIDRYLESREAQANETRERLQQLQGDLKDIRARLAARREQRGQT